MGKRQSHRRLNGRCSEISNKGEKKKNRPEDVFARARLEEEKTPRCDKARSCSAANKGERDEGKLSDLC